MKYLYITVFILLTLTGCITYYQQQIKYQDAIYARQFRKADQILEKESGKKSKNQMLHLLERGFVQQQLGDHAASNRYFLEADRMMEDYKKSNASEAISFLTNPMTKPYTPEDLEIVMVHYYLAINFLMMHNLEAARVECRRMQLAVQELNDKNGNKNKYACDAFAFMLSAMIYEAEKDYNNAFIAYRNAYNCYSDLYTKELNTPVPKQLKIDLIRTAYLNGFYSEQQQYENIFGLKHTPENTNQKQGEVIIFLNKGLGPVKAENSINFTMVHGAGGMVNFVNQEYALNFPFQLPASDKDRGALGSIQMIRVAFPKYVERKPVYSSVSVNYQGRAEQPEKAEDIRAIAFKTLADRQSRELGNALLRLAIKKGIEHSIRQQDQTLGALAGLAGAVTEKADTRNWQTLPDEIHYLRLKADTGYQSFIVNWSGRGAYRTDTLRSYIRSGSLHFLQSTAPESIME
jgi:uncharacterized protein